MRGGARQHLPCHRVHDMGNTPVLNLMGSYAICSAASVLHALLMGTVAAQGD